ncbi:MAG: Dam family site-specific DNA-(adenine-N6)-methyltransferase [Tannerella sp.]|jgi:DNA adenine methylase|nr:Dam family site-specific DNA-(adenine-N6)-methyltransferase [Tannerella sp.]
MLGHKANFPPVIKWSGSKRSVAKHLSAYLPEGKRYFEPFLGGGALLPFRNIATGLAGDIIPELINLWNAIKITPELVAKEYRKRWIKLQKEGYEIFYKIRDDFNRTRNEHDFLFLTRTCVNGLIRYNNKGEFNNSFHLTRPGINPENLKEVIFQWHLVIKGIDFYNCDYRDLTSQTMKGDFVFFDPPYGGTKGRYTKEKIDLPEFFSELDRLNCRNVKWMLTFDGQAGDRNYSYDLPKELYRHKIFMKTGHSPFTKLMNTTIDDVKESVYLNFNPPAKLTATAPDNIDKEATLFATIDM